MLSLEYVTFEASQYVHSYSNIEFKFTQQGTIVPKISVYTMRLDHYKTFGDKVRAAFEIIYLILLLFNIILFFY